AEESQDIKAMLIICEKDSVGEDEYSHFMKKIIRKDIDENIGERQKFVDRETQLARYRSINVLNQFLTLTLSLNKITVMAMQGSVATPFLGLSLATDFRFTTEDMKYALTHKKFGLHPSGGIPFLLPRYIGVNKATEILLTKEYISAQEAFELGLINKILPKENFEKHVINEIQQFLMLDLNQIYMTCRLLHYFDNDIQKYLELEEKFI
ncbi:MAG: enoyl-CoA hydratase/isomerase family protein, partial [Planctomycetes bacterium]|nr:enoyl-CoA hydratase/isomerase family protein [Planctomycetota bacterium]